MNTFLISALALAMLTTLVVLIVGVVAMTRGGAFNEKYGQKLMRLRVMCQGVALAFFALLLLSGSQG
jgi:hypothetical protein